MTAKELVETETSDKPKVGDVVIASRTFGGVIKKGDFLLVKMIVDQAWILVEWLSYLNGGRLDNTCCHIPGPYIFRATKEQLRSASLAALRNKKPATT